MLKRFFAATAAVLLLSILPSLAGYSDLQTSTATVVDNQVVVQVDNPCPSDETATVQMTVKVQDGSTEVLTIPSITYEASSSTLVTVSASAPITQIIDEPDPISN